MASYKDYQFKNSDGFKMCFRVIEPDSSFNFTTSHYSYELPFNTFNQAFARYIPFNAKTVGGLTRKGFSTSNIELEYIEYSSSTTSTYGWNLRFNDKSASNTWRLATSTTYEGAWWFPIIPFYFFHDPNNDYYYWYYSYYDYKMGYSGNNTYRYTDCAYNGTTDNEGDYYYTANTVYTGEWSSTAPYIFIPKINQYMIGVSGQAPASKMSYYNVTTFAKFLLGESTEFDPDDPNKGGGDSTGGGGGGDGEIGGTPHKGGEIPTISALDSGLITLYNPSVVQLQSLGQFLWSDNFSLDSFKKLFNDPFDTLLGLSIVPIAPTVSGTHNIMFGNLDSNVSANVVANQFVEVDCGTLTLNETWNGALDYAPSTQVSIYLPFIGVRQLNTNDVMGSTLHLYYRFDVLTGSCVAEITIDHTSQGNKSSGFSYNSDMGSVYTYIGQCGVNIPLASRDYTNTIRAAISAVGMVAGVGASVATGNPAIGIASVITQSANIGMQANTPTVERSGHLSGSSALLSSYEPCLFVTRPHQCKPQKYYALRGVPSQVYVSALNKATGFFQIADVQNIHCSGATDSELTEIKTKLTQGVFVTTWPSDLSGSTDLDVQLYNNTSAVNRIDKSLTGIRSGDNALDGTFRDSVNIDRPTIRLRINDISDLKHANYMYIAMFERYYFIDSITSVRNNIVEIQGHIDVLKTYGYQIGQNTAILSRSSQAGSSGYGNTYLDDNLLATYQDTYNVSYPWGYTFSHDNDSLILAVAGASISSTSTDDDESSGGGHGF